MDFRFLTRRRMVVAGALCFAVVGGILFYLANTLGLDTTPLARPVVNAPFVRTPQQTVDIMLELAGPREDELLYDLGCGDGRIVVRAAEKYGCRAVGFDIDPQRVNDARANVRRGGVDDRVTIVEQDILQLDLSDADVVTLYLLPRLNEKLIPQLQLLKPGARIVSHDFDLPGIEPDEVVPLMTPEGERQHVVYLWVAPLRSVAGPHR